MCHAGLIGLAATRSDFRGLKCSDSTLFFAGIMRPYVSMGEGES